MTVTIRFTRDSYDYEDSTPHAEGDTVSCEDSTAQRWIRRGACVVTDEPDEVTLKANTTISRRSTRVKRGPR